MDDNKELNGVEPENDDEAKIIESTGEEISEEISEEIGDADEVKKSDTFQDNYTEPSLKDAEIVVPEMPTEKSDNAAAARRIGGADAYRAARAEKFCVKCGKNRKAKDSDYCDECRLEMLTSSTPALGWIAAFVALTASLFALLVLGFNLPVARLVLEAKHEESRSCWVNAYSDYYDAIELAEQTNAKYTGKVECVVLGERFNANMLETVFNANPSVDTILNFGNIYYSIVEKYDKLGMYKELIDAYYSVKSGEAIRGVLTGVQYGTITYEQAMEELNKVPTKTDMERIVLDAIKLSVCDTYLIEVDEYYAALSEIYSAAEKDMPEQGWFYNSGLMECYFSTGEYEKMATYCNRVIEANRNDNNAAYRKMVYLMASDKKDEAQKFSAEFTKYNPGLTNVAVACERRFGSLDAAIEMSSRITGDQMSAVEDKVEFYRQQALAYIAKGDYASAFDVSYLAINEAQSLSSFTNNAYSSTMIYETLIVSAYLCYENGADSGEYTDYVTSVYSGEDTDISEFSPLVQDILTGKKDAVEILKKGAGDLL